MLLSVSFLLCTSYCIILLCVTSYVVNPLIKNFLSPTARFSFLLTENMQCSHNWGSVENRNLTRRKYEEWNLINLVTWLHELCQRSNIKAWLFLLLNTRDRLKPEISLGEACRHRCRLRLSIHCLSHCQKWEDKWSLFLQRRSLCYKFWII